MPNRKSSIAPVGKEFGYLTVLGYSHAEYKSHRKVPRWIDYWLCGCRCGSAPRPYESGGLVNGHNTSCGCYDYHLVVHGESGNSQTPEYRAYRAMKSRCLNPNNGSYHRYGGRGIKIYEPWIDNYSAFLAYMGRKPSPLHSLDRYPNNNGNYEPGNVRWATRQQQQENTSTNKFITFENETLTIASWARRKGLNSGTLWTRIYRYGQSLEQALNTPVES